MVKTQGKVIDTIKEILQTVITALIIAVVVNQIAAITLIIGHSMDPTLADGQRLIVNKIVYLAHMPSHGDIIVFYPDSKDGLTYVKRVIAVEGDKFEIKDNKVILNGKVLNEPYINEPMWTENMEEITLMDGELFVMGDNRNNSTDSRIIGVIQVDDIVGRLSRED